MVINFSICDDNPKSLNEIHDTICRLSDQYKINVSLYSSAGELLDSMKEAERRNQLLPDFVLIDIEMPEMNGIELGKQIKTLFPDVCLVLVTSYLEYAVKGYEAKAYRYLLKPITIEYIEALIQDFMREQNQIKKVLVKDKAQEHLLLIKDIVYISAEDKYTILYTENNHYFDYKSLKEYEELLTDYGFYRIHRKYLINMYYHKSLGKGFVTLSCNVELPISRRKENEYREKLLKMLERDIL